MRLVEYELQTRIHYDPNNKRKYFWEALPESVVQESYSTARKRKEWVMKDEQRRRIVKITIVGEVIYPKQTERKGRG